MTDTLIFMIDTESFGLEPDSVMRELSFISIYKSDLLSKSIDSRSIHVSYQAFLPTRCQVDAGRKIYPENVAWMLKSGSDYYAEITDNVRPDEGLASITHELTKFLNYISSAIMLCNKSGKRYEVWFRRPQHDIPMLKSVMRTAGMMQDFPWAYSTVNDLASVMNLLGLDSSCADNSDIIQHRAYDDNLFQLRCLKVVFNRVAELNSKLTGGLNADA